MGGKGSKAERASAYTGDRVLACNIGARVDSVGGIVNDTHNKRVRIFGVRLSTALDLREVGTEDVRIHSDHLDELAIYLDVYGLVDYAMFCEGNVRITISRRAMTSFLMQALSAMADCVQRGHGVVGIIIGEE